MNVAETARGALVCLDPGDVRIGLAIRPFGTNLALGRPALPAGPALGKQLRQIVEELDAVAILVGLPLHLRGVQGAAVDKAVTFARQVQQACNRPVLLVDERLSSVQAQQALRAAGRKTRGPRSPRGPRGTRGDIDSASAIIVLQGYLDGIRAIPLDEFDSTQT